MKPYRIALSALLLSTIVWAGFSAHARQSLERAGISPRGEHSSRRSTPVTSEQTGGSAPVLALDDGSFERAIGVIEQANPPTYGNQAVFLNRFTPAESSLPFTVDTVLVLFPFSDQFGETGLESGQPFDILVYIDPSGSGNPANTTQVVQQRIAITPSNSSFQVVRLVNPVVVESGDVWVGFTNTVTGFDSLPIYPAAEDTDNPAQNRSWFFFNDSPRDHFGGGPLSGAAAAGITVGDWLIRVSGQAGGVTAICWDAPASSRGGPLPPPDNTRICSMIPPLPVAEPGARQGALVGYNVYRANQPGVQPTSQNLFTTVPPNQTNTNTSVSPGGSFFTVTALYEGGESGPSNEIGVFPPTVTNTKVKANKIRVDGSDFQTPVQVLIDGVPFVTPPTFKRNGMRMIQKGPLATGQTVFEYLNANGGTGKMVIRNANGALRAVDISN
jgi:hypothetical protein